MQQQMAQSKSVNRVLIQIYSYLSFASNKIMANKKLKKKENKQNKRSKTFLVNLFRFASTDNHLLVLLKTAPFNNE